MHHALIALKIKVVQRIFYQHINLHVPERV